MEMFRHDFFFVKSGFNIRKISVIMCGKIRLDGRKNIETIKGFPIVNYLTKDSKEKLILTGYNSKKQHWNKAHLKIITF